MHTVDKLMCKSQSEVKQRNNDNYRARLRWCIITTVCEHVSYKALQHYKKLFNR